MRILKKKIGLLLVLALSLIIGTWSGENDIPDGLDDVKTSGYEEMIQSH